MARMPYRATTATGNQFDFEFELHPETGEPVHVANLLTALLETLDREIGVLGRVGNGDVLQALAMTLAVRGRMLGGRPDVVEGLIRELVDAALGSSAQPGAANVDPGEAPSLH